MRSHKLTKRLEANTNLLSCFISIISSLEGGLKLSVHKFLSFDLAKAGQSRRREKTYQMYLLRILLALGKIFNHMLWTPIGE